MLKSFLAAITVAATLSSFTASAETADSGSIDTRIVTAMSLDDVRTLITSYEHKIIDEMSDQTGFVVETPGGFKYLIMLRMCDEARSCQGVLIGSIHDLPAGTTWELLNQIDIQMEAFGLTVANEKLVVDRFLVLSGGVQMENFKHEIGRLILVAPAVVSGIAQLVETAPEG